MVGDGLNGVDVVVVWRLRDFGSRLGTDSKLQQKLIFQCLPSVCRRDCQSCQGRRSCQLGRREEEGVAAVQGRRGCADQVHCNRVVVSPGGLFR